MADSSSGGSYFWGQRDEPELAPGPVTPSPVAPPPRRSDGRYALALALVVAVGAIVTFALLLVGSSSLPGANAELTQALRAAPPVGQWIATGSITDYGYQAFPGGATQIRAWKIERVCSRGNCRIELFRQLIDDPSHSYDETRLVPQSSAGTLVQYAADFAPVGTQCETQSSNGVRHLSTSDLTDHFLVVWIPRLRQLTASETSSGNCGGFATARIQWTATAVTPPAEPAFVLSRTHAPSVAAFHAAVQQVCASAKARIAPTLEELKTGAQASDLWLSTAERAQDADDLAQALPKLIPEVIAMYNAIPQPPAPLEALWLQDVRANRSILPSVAGLFSEIANADAARAVSLRNGSVLAEERAAAWGTLASAEYGSLTSINKQSNALERRLGIPENCGSSNVSVSGGGGLA